MLPTPPATTPVDLFHDPVEGIHRRVPLPAAEVAGWEDVVGLEVVLQAVGDHLLKDPY